jgi:hypothetical protein
VVFVSDDAAPPLPPVLPVVLPLLVVVLVLAAVAAAVAVALFGRSSRSALFYLISPPMVVCAFGSIRAYAWCFSHSL